MGCLQETGIKDNLQKTHDKSSDQCRFLFGKNDIRNTEIKVKYKLRIQKTYSNIIYYWSMYYELALVHKMQSSISEW